MPAVFLKTGRAPVYWARIKGEKQPGKWTNVSTGETDKAKAEAFARKLQAAIDKRNITRPPGSTLRDYIATWLVKRREADHDWKRDRGRLTNHVLPVLGALELAAITVAHVADLVHRLRFKTKLAPRTVRNVYSVLAAAMRDAAIEGKIAASPCTLTDVQLGPVEDADPEWRDTALFSHAEVETLISDTRIPFDRRVVYAFGVLAGLRPGEGAALRWRHYDAASEPLGNLTVAISYSTSKSETKATKTRSVRHVPVHPALAALLVDWFAHGWAEMMGRDPTPEDLIVPLPPDAEARRYKRRGEAFRGWDYTGVRWRKYDLPMLGWRDRNVYDTRSTFISLAIQDGADPDIIRERVTHTKSRRTAFSGYVRGSYWDATCREVAKLRITLLAPRLLTSAHSPTANGADSGGFVIHEYASEDMRLPTVVDGGERAIATSCDQMLAVLGAMGANEASEQKRANDQDEGGEE